MPVPELSPRPTFDTWLRTRKLNYSACGTMLGCSRETLRRYCLPFSDPERRFPNKRLLKKIEGLTNGEITGRDFCEPPVTNARREPVAA
jgi:hypothetical protein